MARKMSPNYEARETGRGWSQLDRSAFCGALRMESSLLAKEIREARWMEGRGVSGKLAGTGRALPAEGGERPRLCWVAGWGGR